jgi:hypothetical protein
MEVRPVQQWEEPPHTSIMFQRALGLMTIIVGGLGLLRHRRTYLLPWLACVTSWFTVCKYAICTHCEHHGEFCEFYGLGKHAARMFPNKRKHALSPFGWATEAVSASGMLFLPFLGVKDNRRGLMLYTLLVLATQTAQLFISCRRCALTATDPWKNMCPGYHIARRLFVDQ